MFWRGATSKSASDKSSDGGDSEAIMPKYQSIPGPPEGEGEEEAQDIGQEFNSNLPPRTTATSSAATADNATTETLPPLPSSPSIKARPPKTLKDRRSVSFSPDHTQRTDVVPALYRVCSTDLQRFPDEPIGGLTPPRALSTLSNSRKRLAKNSHTTPKIRIIRASTSSAVTLVAAQRIRSATGSIGTIHSLLESINDCSPKSLPYYEPIAAISDLALDESQRNDQLPSDDAIYDHYSDIAGLGGPTAESSAMGAKRAALQEKYEKLAPSEKSSNQDKRSFLETIKLSKRAAAAVDRHNKNVNRHNKKASKECERQAKLKARSAKHRNSSIWIRPSMEKGKGAEDASQTTWTDPASIVVSRFRPAAPGEAPSPGASFRRVNSQSRENGPALLPSDQGYESRDPNHSRQSHYRQHVKGAIRKSIRQSRRLALRSFILKLLVGRDVAEVVQILQTRKAKEGDLDGIDALIDLANNLDLCIPKMTEHKPKKARKTKANKATESETGRGGRKRKGKAKSSTRLDVDHGDPLRE